MRKLSIPVLCTLLIASLAWADGGVITIRGQELSPGAQLPGANLVSVEGELDGKDLTGISLAKGQLRDAKLPKVNLTRASLRGADLSRASFGDAILTAADLREVATDNSYFIGANLERADLRGANLVRSRFQRTNLKRADLSGARIDSTSFEGADLSYANLSGITFELGAVFTGANLQGVEWGSTDLNGCFFGKKKCGPGSTNGICR